MDTYTLIGGLIAMLLVGYMAFKNVKLQAKILELQAKLVDVEFLLDYQKADHSITNQQLKLCRAFLHDLETQDLHPVLQELLRSTNKALEELRAHAAYTHMQYFPDDEAESKAFHDEMANQQYEDWCKRHPCQYCGAPSETGTCDSCKGEMGQDFAQYEKNG